VKRAAKIAWPSFALRESGNMSERTTEERQDWKSDIVWVALYSILIFLLMVGWAAVPA
jgi:hypothetical protein